MGEVDCASKTKGVTKQTNFLVTPLPGSAGTPPLGENLKRVAAPHSPGGGESITRIKGRGGIGKIDVTTFVLINKNLISFPNHPV